MLSPQDLLVVATIADAGTLTLAAERLATSQPALSRTLRQLEERAGAQLFERLVRGVRPTAVGDAMLRHARAIQAVTARAALELESSVTHGLAVVRVGVVPTFSPIPMARAVRALADEAQAVQVLVETGAEPDLVEALRRGRLDLLIAPVRDWQVEFRATPLFEDRSVIVARADHPVLAAFRAGGAGLAALGEHPWVGPSSEDPVAARLAALFRDAGIEPPRPRLLTRDWALAIALVVEAGHLAVVPRDVVAFGAQVAPLVVLPPALPGPPEPVGALQRPELETPPEVGVLLRMIRDELHRVGLGLSAAES